jgi:hypothetical protein
LHTTLLAEPLSAEAIAQDVPSCAA